MQDYATVWALEEAYHGVNARIDQVQRDLELSRHEIGFISNLIIDWETSPQSMGADEAIRNLRNDLAEVNAELVIDSSELANLFARRAQILRELES